MSRRKFSLITALRNNIELQFNAINISVSVLLIITLLSFAFYTITSLTSEIAEDYAELYSFKTTSVLNSQIKKDIGILTSAAHSLNIVEWFEDEQNAQKKQSAFYAMKTYTNVLENGILYFAVAESGAEYNFDRTTTEESFVNSAHVHPDNPDDGWYFETRNAQEPYRLNVDTDKILKRTLVWVNHKVINAAGKVLGVICTGEPFDKILKSAFEKYNIDDIRGVVVDRYGVVQMDSANQQNTFLDDSTLYFKNLFPAEGLLNSLATMQASMTDYYTEDHRPNVVRLPRGHAYNYAAISPIEGTDWVVITFFSAASLFSVAKLTPFLWVAVALFLFYVLVVTVACKKLLFMPLAKMVQSLRFSAFAPKNHAIQSKYGVQDIYGSDRHDELGMLAKTIQRLRKKLQRNNEKLTCAAEEARNASQAKTHFLAHMSHEMRTPMNAIIGMSKIAKETDQKEKIHTCLTKIETASTHLLGIINDVLDMSKIEAKKIDINLTIFDLSQCIQRIISVVGFRMTDKGQKFETHIDSKLPLHLISDEQRISQVITNFLSNAEKFTPEGGTITLNADLVESNDNTSIIRVSITDTGIGVSSEQQEELFQPFQQANSSISHKFGGTGLGLSICKQIIEFMGGSIFFSSEEGKGTCVGFTLPCTRPDAQSLEEYMQDEQGISSAEALDLAGKTILLVEDIEINREIVMALLEETGVAIDIAENGLVALEKVTENAEAYNLILMDIRMPEMDGYEATRHIRALNNHYAQRVPIIAMTANAFREDVEQCFEVGMNAHVGKPIDFNDFFTQIAKALTIRI